MLLTHWSEVPSTGLRSGLPPTRISSAGVVLTKTLGAFFASSFLPGSAAFTSFQLSSAGSFLKLSGSVSAGVQGPFTSAAFSQEPSLRR